MALQWQYTQIYPPSGMQKAGNGTRCQQGTDCELFAACKITEVFLMLKRTLPLFGLPACFSSLPSQPALLPCTATLHKALHSLIRWFWAMPLMQSSVQRSRVMKMQIALRLLIFHCLPAKNACGFLT